MPSLRRWRDRSEPSRARGGAPRHRPGRGAGPQGRGAGEPEVVGSSRPARRVDDRQRTDGGLDANPGATAVTGRTRNRAGRCNGREAVDTKPGRAGQRPGSGGHETGPGGATAGKRRKRKPGRATASRPSPDPVRGSPGPRDRSRPPVVAFGFAGRPTDPPGVRAVRRRRRLSADPVRGRLRRPADARRRRRRRGVEPRTRTLERVGQARQPLRHAAREAVCGRLHGRAPAAGRPS